MHPRSSVLRRLAVVVLVLGLGWFGPACEETLLDTGLHDLGSRDAPADAPTVDTRPQQLSDSPRVADWPTTLVLSPINPTVTFESGKATPTVAFTASLGGKTMTARWSLDQGEFGAVSTAGVFTPSGSLGGTVKVTAQVGSLKASTTVTVLLKMGQNGLTKQNGNPGPGGFGGVGGEGLGPAVSATLVTLLNSSSPKAGTIKLLYPYAKTVWPLGILAPLLQWTAPPTGSGDAVMITLSSGFFQFRGTFGRPKALASTAALVRHPIPQDVWKAATRSAAGSALTLSVVLASGGVAYGPMTSSWTVARGRLRGTVYYQSYGTNLAKNYSGAKGGDGKFGGATLAIRGGSTDPTLVAGKTGDKTACRVCHSVNAKGTRMVVQHGDKYQATSSYDLLTSYAETIYPASTIGKLGWVGMTPDGKLGLGNAVPIPGGANTAPSALYDMTSGAAVSSTGLSTFVTRAGFPMFSPDGGKVAFTFYAGPGDAAIGKGDQNKLVVMDFDASKRAFSNPKLLYKGTSTTRPGWPAFWPTGKALVFQRERAGNWSREYFATRSGGRGDLWWVDLATGKAAALALANGKNGTTSYLPTGPSSHDDDTTLNYEPTVSPIASGGYAWVVFMSRRLYGNVATIDPWLSDPRSYDHHKNVTTRKLWVAAIDLNPKAGDDPSHPAFYLPAQEIIAGNSRGFWVVDPCKADGQPCQGGDECCGGYCTQSPKTNTLVCGKVAMGCAKEFDRCKQSADCCDYPKFLCVNGHCARWSIK